MHALINTIDLMKYMRYIDILQVSSGIYIIITSLDNLQSLILIKYNMS